MSYTKKRKQPTGSVAIAENKAKQKRVCVLFRSHTSLSFVLRLLKVSLNCFYERPKLCVLKRSILTGIRLEQSPERPSNKKSHGKKINKAVFLILHCRWTIPGMIPQHMQQSSFPASGNPFVSIIPSAGAGVGGNNGLSQHYPTHGQAQQQAYAMGRKPQYIPMSAYGTDILGGEFPRNMAADPQSFAQTHAIKQQQQQQQQLQQQQQDHIYKDVLNLLNDNTRETALLELSKKREQYEDLAIVLWHSFGKDLFESGDDSHVMRSVGVMSVLLQEIVSVYPLLIPANLSGGASNRVCNALALLQCVANHDETRTLFLSGKQPKTKRKCRFGLYLE